METFCIVIADAGRAVVFSKSSSFPGARVVHEFDNPDARLLTSEIVSDGAGRLDKGTRTLRSHMEARTNAHETKAVDFARKIANVLESDAGCHSFDHLVLVAPAHFLGLLDSNLGHGAKKLLSFTQVKDLMHASRPELERRIGQWIGNCALKESAD